MDDNAKNILKAKVFNRAIFFLKFRPRSEKEVRDNLRTYLEKVKIPFEQLDDVINITIERLKNLDFINDKKFIYYWLERRLRDNPKGKRIIIIELKKKGINIELINKILEKEQEIYPRETIIKKLIEKAQRKYRLKAFPMKKEKILSYILRRGFSYGEIHKIIDETLKKQ